MPWLFGITLFLSAALLFWVQPMLGKMLLPYLGGSPGVWNTCMVFFQALLLGGYAYAHWLGRTRHPVWRVGHLLLLVVGILLLPFAIREGQILALQQGASPQPWLLSTLLAVAGLPFFLISSTGPLLQKWFAEQPRARHADPYVLYAASNAGSFLALLAYPLLLEPLLALRQQTEVFKYGYGLLIVAIAICAWVSRGSANSLGATTENPRPNDARHSITGRRRWCWIGLAFIPSSLMLGLTHYLSTDIASIPLMWIVPLLLYLLSFILVFGSPRHRGWSERVLPYLAVAVVFLMVIRATQPVWLLIVLHCLFFFVAAVVSHGRLAADRPVPSHLTEFYFWMSVGGVLGGLFNALLAPLIFSHIWEYPLVIVAACLIRQSPASPAGELTSPGAPNAIILRERKARLYDFAWPVAVAMLAICLVLITPWLGLKEMALRNLIAGGIPILCAFLFVRRPIRFALSLAAVLGAGVIWDLNAGQQLRVERNFFGVSKVIRDAQADSHSMIHGNTTHGRQFQDPDRRCEPLTYYHRRGPVGSLFAHLEGMQNKRVGVIGLGTGSMISYARPGDHWTYFEIDPAVLSIARNPRLFSYLSSCHQEAQWDLVAGDARLQLRTVPERSFDLLVVDAFSSDAIPVHLLTRQAVELYLSRLKTDGLLAFHISNRYLELRPVVGDLAGAFGLTCLGWDDQTHSQADQLDGKEQSHWVVMGRANGKIDGLSQRNTWQMIPARAGQRPWSDDFSHILSAFKWN